MCGLRFILLLKRWGTGSKLTSSALSIDKICKILPEYEEVCDLAESDDRATLGQTYDATNVGQQPHQRGVLVAFDEIIANILENKIKGIE